MSGWRRGVRDVGGYGCVGHEVCFTYLVYVCPSFGVGDGCRVVYDVVVMVMRTPHTHSPPFIKPSSP